MKFLFSLFILYIGFWASAQERVTFLSSDSLRITADLYLNNAQENPFIILFHQAESSRGEYIAIAPKLKNLGYNCLAVDLRSGLKSNYIKNETAERAKKHNLSSKYIDAKKDMAAAIDFIKRYNHKPVILFGSSYSASLSLILASEFDNIQAIIAFSPGEYFKPDLEVKSKISDLKIPIFLAATELEYNYVKELTTGIEKKYKTFYKPAKGPGVHGAKALWEDNSSSRACWFELTYFIGKL
jgi:dienelactone hydrolase